MEITRQGSWVMRANLPLRPPSASDDAAMNGSADAGTSGGAEVGLATEPPASCSGSSSYPCSPARRLPRNQR